MIPIAGPSITEKEIEYVRQAVADSWYGNAGSWVRRFEEAFAVHVSRGYGVATNSCTAALHLAMQAMDIGPGDEVIVPDITWIATAAPVRYVGATPVFADVNARSWCLDTDSVEANITPRTKAIIGVDLYGSMPNWSALTEIAQRHDLWLVEDAAQAMGSELYGKKAGWFGDVSVFSFHGTKTLTTGGEGGMLLTNNGTILEKARYYQNHCRDRQGRMFWNTDVGYKYKMTDMQAAMGCAQLERVDELVAMKTRIFGWYKTHLQAVGLLNLNMNVLTDVIKEFVNSYWMTTIDYKGMNSKISKEDLIVAMASVGIACRPFFYPLSSLTAFADLMQCRMFRHVGQANKVAYEISPQAINLPSALSLTEEDVVTVCQTLKGLL